MHPENDPYSPREPGDEPLQGQVRHESLSAVVPREVSAGVFSNGVLLLSGPHEVVLDFLLRLGEQQRLTARVILPHAIGRQLAAALDQDLRMFESQFGSVPRIPRPLPPPSAGHSGRSASDALSPPDPPGAGQPSSGWSAPFGGPADHPENRPEPPREAPSIEELYQELKLTDEVLAGAYANSVLIRHSGTEFCFDFITNIYPRSAVSARIFMAVPHVVPLLNSLIRALQTPGNGPRYA